MRIDVIFMRHFNPCGFRVNTSIMFKEIITLSKPVCKSGAEIFTTKAPEKYNNEIKVLLRG